MIPRVAEGITAPRIDRPRGRAAVWARRMRSAFERHLPARRDWENNRGGSAGARLTRHEASRKTGSRRLQWLSSVKGGTREHGPHAARRARDSGSRLTKYLDVKYLDADIYRGGGAELASLPARISTSEWRTSETRGSRRHAPLAGTHEGPSRAGASRDKERRPVRRWPLRLRHPGGAPPQRSPPRQRHRPPDSSSRADRSPARSTG